MESNTQDQQSNPKMREPEAADYLGVGYSTLRRWRNQGIGPTYVRLNTNTLYYHKSDLDAFIKRRRHEEIIIEADNSANLKQDFIADVGCDDDREYN